jgi:hypothetical protein
VTKPGKGWQTVQPGDATGGQFVSLTSNFSDPYEVVEFQQAIICAWVKFDGIGISLSEFAKGTTLFSKSFTSASFVAKAIKTGFDAIGKPMSTGLKLTNWSIDDLLAYANWRAPAIRDSALIDFKAYAPLTAYKGKGDPMRPADMRTLPRIDSAAASSFKGVSAKSPGLAGEWFHYEKDLENVNGQGAIPFQRVIAYGFRGETRPPGAVKGAGGFLPNYTRPEHIDKHAQQLKQALAGKDMDALDTWMEAETGALNLERFIRDQRFKGFVSTSKSVSIAKNFATAKWMPNGAMSAGQVDGWVYACHMLGAFELPPRFSHPWIKFAEQELTMPGMIDWENVVACRRVLRTGEFDGWVYMRPTLPRTDPKAAKKLMKLLSGKSQGPGLA